MNQLTLNIADFIIQLSSELAISLEDGYIPFVCKDQKPDVHINCYENTRIPVFEKEQLVFEAANETQKFYSIYKYQNKLGFVIYNQQNIDQIQQTAVLSDDFKTWEIYSSSDENGVVNPLRYPMGPIVMQYLTVKSEAVMIHASCVFDGIKGRLFTGFSGAGKSTISEIWSKAGHQIINDDRLIIRKTNEGYYAYNTPMYYADQPKRAALNSIFLISHSPENRIKKLSGALAVSRVLAFCIQNNFDKTFIQNNLDFVAGLSNQVAVYDLGFVPDDQVVKFVLSNENT